LDLEGVGTEVAAVDVAPGRPGVDDLAVQLGELGEEGRGVGRVEAGFLGELPHRRVERVGGGGVELALGDRPRGVVLLRPERPAGVNEKDLHHPVGDPVQQDARAVSAHARSRPAGRGSTTPGRPGPFPYHTSMRQPSLPAKDSRRRGR